MWFIKLAISSIVGFVIAKEGQTMGNLVYRVLSAQWDYFWAKANEGYFKDYPDDPDKENTPKNVLKRIKVCYGK